jgi:hypothetical protein
MNSKIKTLVAIGAVLVLQACASSEKLEVTSTRSPLPADCEVRIYPPDDSRPEHFEVLGTVEFGDAGLSVDCGKDAVREAMRAEACKAGGNGVIILKEKFPSLVSTCYRATAQLVYVEK